MPNYRYHTPDYMHRSGCGRPASAPQPSAPCSQPSASCSQPSMPCAQPAVPCAQPAAPCARPADMPVCCDGKYDELSGMPLAMAYVPWQEWQNIYEAEKGFHCGTIFEELNMPFNGIRMGGCCK